MSGHNHFQGQEFQQDMNFILPKASLELWPGLLETLEYLGNLSVKYSVCVFQDLSCLFELYLEPLQNETFLTQDEVHNHLPSAL